ncbi:MAG: metal ABC transporter permease [Planctomycetes bacterium]|nr:metal ABC transporter permease [Planctomycetota bacterium]
MIDYVPQWLIEWHAQYPYVPKMLLAGVLVSSVCAVIGCFIILRRMAFLGDALAHSMLAGVVGGYLLMKLAFGAEASAPAMVVGSIIAGFLTVAMIGFISKTSRIKEDTAIGIMYTGIFAVGGLFASLFSKHIHLDLYHFVVGSVLVVSDAELWMMAGVAAFVLTMVILFFRHLTIASFDPVMAASLGIPVLALDYLLTACTALVVVSAVQIVGVVLVVGMLVTPAASAYLLCDRLSRMIWVSTIFGVASFVAGYGMSEVINVAPASAIIVVGTGVFLVVLIAAPRYGLVADWLRRRRAVPQQLVEDVLGCVLRAPGKKVSLATVLTHVEDRPEAVRRAVRSLARGGLLEVENGTVELTDDGRREAQRLLRAHRLWETYLEHAGAPHEKLHKEAHRLEHINAPEAIDYLDDMLGHPLRDPHGAEIPEDATLLAPGRQVKASLLREGRTATVADVQTAAEDTPLAPGIKITCGPRREGDAVWTVFLDDGREVLLDHAAADAVTVVLE